MPGSHGLRIMDWFFKQHFPNISDVEKKKTSDLDDTYNCIAWAFKDSQRHWWPNKMRSFWPIDVVGMTDIEAFEEWFRHDGWEETGECDFEKGYEKIALYTLNSQPTHAARLIDNGVWTSKLGTDIDLSHSLTDLNGPAYGSPTRFFKKPIS
jgi:hypothetical protein